MKKYIFFTFLLVLLAATAFSQDVWHTQRDIGGGGGNLGYTPAHSGANSDITSLTGLTTPLSVGQGGTGSGTAAAGPAAGGMATVLAVEGMVPTAGGGYDVPEDTWARLKYREMVLPEHLADRVRGMTESGGGDHLHVHFDNVMDTKSFEERLRDSGSVINAMLTQAFRDFHLRPGR
jgi:hypothetical protein